MAYPFAKDTDEEINIRWWWTRPLDVFGWVFALFGVLLLFYAIFLLYLVLSGTTVDALGEIRLWDVVLTVGIGIPSLLIGTWFAGSTH